MENEITLTLTPGMLAVVPAVAAILQVIKRMPKSEVITPFLPLLAIVNGILFSWMAKVPEPLWSGVIIGLAASGGYDLLHGLTKSNAVKTSAVIVLICCLLFAGCSQVTMSPGYKMRTEMSAINVAEFNRRCQAGDDLACRDGLKRASDALNLIVDAMTGIESTGGIATNGGDLIE